MKSTWKFVDLRWARIVFACIQCIWHLRLQCVYPATFPVNRRKGQGRAAGWRQSFLSSWQPTWPNAMVSMVSMVNMGLKGEGAIGAATDGQPSEPELPSTFGPPVPTYSIVLACLWFLPVLIYWGLDFVLTRRRRTVQELMPEIVQQNRLPHRESELRNIVSVRSQEGIVYWGRTIWCPPFSSDACIDWALFATSTKMSGNCWRIRKGCGLDCKETPLGHSLGASDAEGYPWFIRIWQGLGWAGTFAPSCRRCTAWRSSLSLCSWRGPSWPATRGVLDAVAPHSLKLEVWTASIQTQCLVRTCWHSFHCGIKQWELFWCDTSQRCTIVQIFTQQLRLGMLCGGIQIWRFCLYYTMPSIKALLVLTWF